MTKTHISQKDDQANDVVARAAEPQPYRDGEDYAGTPPRQDPAYAQTRHSYDQYCELLALGESRLAAGDLAAAAALANVAARFAFPGRVGLFGSPRLENLLLQIGRQLPAVQKIAKGQVDARRRNVLHILSYARPVGGDSRYAWRWIQQDRESRHSVVLTTQADVKGFYEIPKILTDAVADSGGFLQALAAPPTKQLAQASELRALAQGMDVIALHLFPYDIIPTLALAAGCDSSKIVFVNHADHTFWVGSSVCHSIVHLRSQSPQFLRERRGLDPANRRFCPPLWRSCLPQSIALKQNAPLDTTPTECFS